MYTVLYRVSYLKRNESRKSILRGCTMPESDISIIVDGHKGLTNVDG